MFLRKLDLGPSTEPTTTSTTKVPTTTTTTTTTTTKRSTTTKKPKYKYRPTLFFTSPTYGPPHQPYDQCLCPCSSYIKYPQRDPFEEQKILFDLERNRAFSTEEPFTTLSSNDYEEASNFTAETDFTFDMESLSFVPASTTTEGPVFNTTMMDTTTYYPIGDSTTEDQEDLTTFEPTPIVKPKYFQAYEFNDLVAKLQEEDDIENNEAEPSNIIVNCIQSFLLCLQEPEENLAEKAGKCYVNFQTCSGSAILIPDLY